MKNKTYKKLWLKDKIEKKQNFYKRNKNEMRNSKNENWNWITTNEEDNCTL
jgi:hypothetical protein